MWNLRVERFLLVFFGALVLILGAVAFLPLRPPAPGWGFGAQASEYFEPEPSPDYSPQAVIRLQMQALQRNNHRDEGIALVFRFASPANRLATGPLPRFAAMLHGDRYQPLLNCRYFRTSELVVEGDKARQIVLVTTHDGRQAAYLFTLTCQRLPPHARCWMTDSVEALQPDHPSFTS